MSEHTPTPWKYDILDDDNFGISAGWTDIATVYNRDDSPTDKANAEFIVRACNSHGDLLAALKAIVPVARLGVGRYYSNSNPARKEEWDAIHGAEDILREANRLSN